MNGTMKILLAKYHPEALSEEQPMAVLPRLKPYKPRPVITKETQAKLDLLEASQKKVAELKKAQAETKKALDALSTKITALKKKMGIKKRSPEAEAAYQSNLPMFRRLGVLGG